MTKTKDPESEAMNCPIWLSKLCLEENLEEAKNQYVNQKDKGFEYLTELQLCCIRTGES